MHIAHYLKRLVKVYNQNMKLKIKLKVKCWTETNPQIPSKVQVTGWSSGHNERRVARCLNRICQ